MSYTSPSLLRKRKKLPSKELFLCCFCSGAPHSGAALAPFERFVSGKTSAQGGIHFRRASLIKTGVPAGCYIPWGVQKQLDELHIAITAKEEEEAAE